VLPVLPRRQHLVAVQAVVLAVVVWALLAALVVEAPPSGRSQKSMAPPFTSEALTDKRSS